jgi:AGZA family xanthine/uracil permease-like MFS transporter
VLVGVGVIMLSNVAEISWDNIAFTIPAALTTLVMPFTFSIAYGLAAGIISYPLVKAAQGEWRDIHAGQWVLAVAVVFYFFVRTSGIIQGAL